MRELGELFREGIKAEQLNRFKLGRVLDECHSYGCDQLFSELSLHVCKQEGIDTRFNGLDTTSFSLSGEYDVDCDEHTIEIVHGYSKDHRADLKQAVLELVCSHDGGVPVISKSWDGNASDTKIFRERAKSLMKSFKASETPRYLIADSKLYTQETIESYLGEIAFITRVPGSIKREGEVIRKALETPLKQWELLEEKNRFISFDEKHYGLDQRWIVVWSEEGQKRAEVAVEKRCQKEKEVLEAAMKKVGSQKYACQQDALRALRRCGEKAHFHQISGEVVKQEKKYLRKGRPNSQSDAQLVYRVQGELQIQPEKKKTAIEEGSCFVIATTIASEQLSCAEVIKAYKNQNGSVERGFRFLKDPLMFASSLFVKKPSRIMGLLMVMTLALLVYAVAQRRLRQALQRAKETLPNQIRKETDRPTLRWIFQLLGGIEEVIFKTADGFQRLLTGLTPLKKRILSYFGSAVAKIYNLHFQPAPTF